MDENQTTFNSYDVWQTSSGLEFVYCPKCDTILVERSGYSPDVKMLDRGCCHACEREIEGIW